MANYKIYNNSRSFDCVETDDPSAWCDRMGFVGYSWVEVPAPPEQDPAIKLAADMRFGSTLIQTFLLDNREDKNVRTSDSLALLVKFGPAENLLRLGDIKKCRALIAGLDTDLIFTVDRKAKYLSLIDSYLLQ